MTTTRSSLNPGRFLLGFLLRRNLPAGLCFFGVSFFCFPLQYILEIFFSRPSPDGILYLYMSTRAHIYTGLSLAVMFAMVPALSLLLALVQAHWLHSRRASALYHSLPIRRESLLLANAGRSFSPSPSPSPWIISSSGGRGRCGWPSACPKTPWASPWQWGRSSWTGPAGWSPPWPPSPWCCWWP